jgi:hypothetical protein
MSNAMMSSTSPLWTASAKRPTSWRSRAEFGCGARSRSGRQPRFEGCPGTLQGALDRGLAGVEHLGDLGVAEAQHVAQHERRSLAGRQVLEGDDESAGKRFRIQTSC